MVKFESCKVIWDSFESTLEEDVVVNVSNDFSYNDTKVKLDRIFGIIHVANDYQITKPKLCSGSVYEMLLDKQTQPTGTFVLLALELDSKLDESLRQVLFRSSKAVSIQIVDYLTTILKSKHSKILVLLNPFSGSRLAKKIYHHTLAPMLALAGLTSSVHLIETQHKNHAEEIVAELDTSAYSAIVPISGDGTVHEIINAIFHRPDWKSASMLPICHVSGGTGNAMGRNFDTTSPAKSILSLIHLKTKNIDLMAIIQDGLLTYTHLSITWAFLADIDLESERYRSLGFARFTAAALHRMIRRRSYAGQIWMLGPKVSSAHQLAAVSKSNGPPLQYISTGNEHLNWPIQMNGTYQCVTACNLPWLATDLLWAPTSTSNDGQMSFSWAEESTYSSILGAVLSGADGRVVAHDSMRTEAVVAFALDPQGYTYGKSPPSSRAASRANSASSIFQDKAGLISVSGEKVPYKFLKCEILPGLLKICVPGWLDDSRWKLEFEKIYGNKFREINETS